MCINKTILPHGMAVDQIPSMIDAAWQRVSDMIKQKLEEVIVERNLQHPDQQITIDDVYRRKPTPVGTEHFYYGVELIMICNHYWEPFDTMQGHKYHLSFLSQYIKHPPMEK